MKLFDKILSAVLLLLNGIGALYGGGHLLLHPDGSSLHMTTAYLEHSPFNTYFLPGVILFVCNGVFSLVVLGMLLLNHPRHPLFVIAQGCILTGWIVIQILMVQDIYFLHVIMGVAGILLMVLGKKLIK